MPARKAVQPDKTSTQVEVPGTEAHLDLMDLSAQICAELAAGLSDAGAVRKRYGISVAQWEVLKRSPIFRGMLKEAVQTWRGDMNAGQRITKKSEILLEEALAELDRIIHDLDVPAVARIEAIKRLESLAGRTKESNNGGGAAGLILNINLGQGRQGVTIEATPQPAVTHESAGD